MSQTTQSQQHDRHLGHTLGNTNPTNNEYSIGNLQMLVDLPDEIRAIIFKKAFTENKLSRLVAMVRNGSRLLSYKMINKFLNAVPRLPNADPDDLWGGWQEVIGWRVIQPLIIKPSNYESFKSFMSRDPNEIIKDYVCSTIHYNEWELLDYSCDNCDQDDVCICDFWKKYDAVSMEHLAELRQEKNNPNYGSEDRLFINSKEAVQIYNYIVMQNIVSDTGYCSTAQCNLFILDAILKWPNELTIVRGKSLMHDILNRLLRYYNPIGEYEKKKCTIWLKIKERLWQLYKIHYKHLSTPHILCIAIRLDMFNYILTDTSVVDNKMSNSKYGLYEPELFLSKKLLQFNGGKQFKYLRVKHDLYMLSKQNITEYIESKLDNVAVFILLDSIWGYNKVVIDELVTKKNSATGSSKYNTNNKPENKSCYKNDASIQHSAKHYQWILSKIADVLLIPPKVQSSKNSKNTGMVSSWRSLSHNIESIRNVYFYRDKSLSGFEDSYYYNDQYYRLYNKYWQFMYI